MSKKATTDKMTADYQKAMAEKDPARRLVKLETLSAQIDKTIGGKINYPRIIPLSWVTVPALLGTVISTIGCMAGFFDPTAGGLIADIAAASCVSGSIGSTAGFTSAMVTSLKRAEKAEEKHWARLDDRPFLTAILAIDDKVDAEKAFIMRNENLLRLESSPYLKEAIKKLPALAEVFKEAYDSGAIRVEKTALRKTQKRPEVVQIGPHTFLNPDPLDSKDDYEAPHM